MSLRLFPLSALALSLSSFSFAGAWTGAAAAAEEGERLARETGQPIWGTGTLVCEALASAFRGEADDAFSCAAEVEAAASRQRLR